MKRFRKPLGVLFGILMIAAGVMHFVRPTMYFAFIPAFLPQALVNYGAGVVEIALGVGTLIPRWYSMATLGILLLMILFLPLHIIDVFKQHPAIGSHLAAVIRLPIQLVLIFWAWYANKRIS